MTDWSGHIDALVGAGLIILVQAFVNYKLWSKIKKVQQNLENK
jgi:hypothetical protein